MCSVLLQEPELFSLCLELHRTILSVSTERVGDSGERTGG